jgi:hypothetical protein
VGGGEVLGWEGRAEWRGWAVWRGVGGGNLGAGCLLGGCLFTLAKTRHAACAVLARHSMLGSWNHTLVDTVCSRQHGRVSAACTLL